MTVGGDAFLDQYYYYIQGVYQVYVSVIYSFKKHKSAISNHQIGDYWGWTDKIISQGWKCISSSCFTTTLDAAKKKKKREKNKENNQSWKIAGRRQEVGRCRDLRQAREGGSNRLLSITSFFRSYYWSQTRHPRTGRSRWPWRFRSVLLTRSWGFQSEGRGGG